MTRAGWVRRAGATAALAASLWWAVPGAAQPATAGPGAAAASVIPADVPVLREPAGTHGAGGGALAALGLFVLVAGAGVLGVLHLRRRGTVPGAALGRWLRAQAASRDAPVRAASVRLTPRHSVHEVQWNGRRLLLGCSEQGVALLASTRQGAPEPDPPLPAWEPRP